MPTFKITLQVGVRDIASVVRAELTTMYFVSCNVSNTDAKEDCCKFSQKISQRLFILESLNEKKDVVSYGDFLTDNGVIYSTLQEAEVFINKVFGDAAS
ncbi:hypothetical protein TNCV_2024061 [Trichonephila clavipes]|nr:hypothetical protein TNCV_2024061 [Trichonephila clavipes]